MGIYVEWDNVDKTIIRYIFEGAWTWYDFRAAIAVADRLLDTVTHTADVILDVTNGQGGVPANALINMHEILDNIHPRLGRVIFTGRDQRAGSVMALKHLLAALSRVYPLKFELLFAPSLSDARQMLSQNTTAIGV